MRSIDLSCGGIAFCTDVSLESGDVVEMVLPMTDNPLIVKTQILRPLPQREGETKPKYAAKFVDLVEDEDFAIRKSVFSIQIDNQR